MAEVTCPGSSAERSGGSRPLLGDHTWSDPVGGARADDPVHRPAVTADDDGACGVLDEVQCPVPSAHEALVRQRPPALLSRLQGAQRNVPSAAWPPPRRGGPGWFSASAASARVRRVRCRSSRLSAALARAPWVGSRERPSRFHSRCLAGNEVTSSPLGRTRRVRAASGSWSPRPPLPGVRHLSTGCVLRASLSSAGAALRQVLPGGTRPRRLRNSCQQRSMSSSTSSSLSSCARAYRSWTRSAADED